MSITNENRPSIIRKKSSFLRDGSYRIFHITKKSEDSDDDDNRNHNKIDSTIGIKKNNSRRKSSRLTNRNGLKQFLFLHKASCELSSSDAKTPPLPRHSTNDLCQSVVGHDTTSVNLLKKPRLSLNQENSVDRSKANGIDEKIAYKNLLVRVDQCEIINRKSVIIPNHPQLRESVRRRRKRFIVACGTVLIASSIIILIVIYVIIMTVRHNKQMNRLPYYNQPH